MLVLAVEQLRVPSVNRHRGPAVALTRGVVVSLPAGGDEAEAEAEEPGRSRGQLEDSCRTSARPAGSSQIRLGFSVKAKTIGRRVEAVEEEEEEVEVDFSI